VAVDDRTNTVLIQDSVSKCQEIRALIKELDVPVKQVLIESRIVFASEDFQNALGVNWGDSEKFAVNLLPALSPLPDNIIQSGIGFSVTKLAGGTFLDLELQALESEGLGKIIASPRLMASNQQLAYIESGEEIPYQEATKSGATSIAFRKAVLRLEVIPQITQNNHILMDLKVNQDSRGIVTNGVPSINTREMRTKVLVSNGETVVLGGIYQQTKNTKINGIPILRKIPLLGKLFRSETSLDQRNELMIFVTPKIMQEGVV